MNNTTKPKRALLRVDILNDFIPPGALPVPDGEAVVEAANELTQDGSYDLVVDIQDWHPANHGSFAANHPGKAVYDDIELDGLPQRLWPVHCVQDTAGADFHPELVRKFRGHEVPVVQKGLNPNVDSYSGFFDNGRRKQTELHALLHFEGIEEVDVVGLATEYCVAATAIDALSLGYKTRVLLSACRGVGITPNDIPDALTRIREAGGEVVEAVESLPARQSAKTPVNGVRLMRGESC